MKELQILGLISLVFFITSCSSGYNIDPNFTKDNKTLEIGKLIFQGAEKKENVIPISTTGRFNMHDEIYYTNDLECSNINYRVVTAIGNNAYLRGSFTDWIQNDYKSNGGCEIEKISNLDFLVCGKYNIRYFITSKVNNQHGNRKNSLLNLNFDCYIKLKKHFLSKMNTSIEKAK